MAVTRTTRSGSTVRTSGTNKTPQKKMSPGKWAEAVNLGKSAAAPLKSTAVRTQLAGGTKSSGGSSNNSSSAGSGSGSGRGSGSGSGSSAGSGGGGGSASSGGSAVTPVGTGTANNNAAGTPAANGWLAGASSIFANDPQAMLAVQLEDQYGKNGASGLYGMLSPFADAANAMYLASGAGGTTDDALAYLNSYWDTLQDPGGRINSGAALTNIFNSQPGTALNSYITTGDPDSQADATLGLIRGALSANYSPLYSSAVMDTLNLERDRYLGNVARGKATGSFVDYLKTAVPNYRDLF